MDSGVPVPSLLPPFCLFIDLICQLACLVCLFYLAVLVCLVGLISLVDLSIWLVGSIELLVCLLVGRSGLSGWFVCWSIYWSVRLLVCLLIWPV